MKYSLAIIAEYRNIAVMEAAGNQVKYWNGIKYFTDGKTYIACNHPDDLQQIEIISFNSEIDAKNFIDAVQDDGIENQKKFLTYCQMHQIIYKNSLKIIPPTFAFDETKKAFVVTISDAGRRHGKS